jgi:hypothetical protein
MEPSTKAERAETKPEMARIVKFMTLYLVSWLVGESKAPKEAKKARGERKRERTYHKSLVHANPALAAIISDPYILSHSGRTVKRLDAFVRKCSIWRLFT